MALGQGGLGRSVGDFGGPHGRFYGNFHGGCAGNDRRPLREVKIQPRFLLHLLLVFLVTTFVIAFLNVIDLGQEMLFHKNAPQS